ncbi:hypothetical protein ACK03K_33890 [[Kitasatospora] papulosa]|uniref:hypothetical protein n=1 Tax=[Kitasatospora] papulosa TaxID=1464011 RepID=UPI00390800EC
MAEAHDEIAAELERLSGMTPDGFVNTVVHHVMGGHRTGAPRDVQAAALASPQMAPRTLDALEAVIKKARSFLPLQENESRSQQAARLAPFRAGIREAMGPYQDVVEDLVHEETKHLAALSDEDFARRWTAFVLNAPVTGPVPRRVQSLAFRSHRVAARADAVCRLMMEEPGRFLPAAEPGESRKQYEAKVRRFRESVTAEQGFLRYAIQYAEARQGRMPAEPNVRLRALRLLGDNHPQELSSLQHQVREDLQGKKKEARRDARAVRRSAGKGAV